MAREGGQGVHATVVAPTAARLTAAWLGSEANWQREGGTGVFTEKKQHFFSGYNNYNKVSESLKVKLQLENTILFEHPQDIEAAMEELPGFKELVEDAQAQVEADFQARCACCLPASQ